MNGWSHNKRSVSNQISSMQACTTSMSGLLGKDIIPKFSKKGHTSLHRLGLASCVQGLPVRPILQKQEQTMQHVKNYVASLNGAKALSLPIPVVVEEPFMTVNLDTITEPSPHERFKKYPRFKMRKLWNKR